jgi:hypothetical protein
MIINEYRIEKHVGGSGRGLIYVLSQHLSRWTKGNNEKLQSG